MSTNDINQAEVESAASINSVSVKLPRFVSTDPEMWLELVDKSFELSKVVKESTKFNHVLTALDPHVVSEVRDILMDPPKTNPYTTLKAALIARLSASQEQKTRRLLEREEMGDSKPSQFLRRLRALAGTSVSESLLRTLWTGRLPSNIQVILATVKNSSLNEAAELADAVAETTNSGPTILEMTTTKKPEDDRMDRLEQSILGITRRLADIHPATERRQPRRQTRSRSRGRSRGRDSSYSSDVCWYHRRFGENARECRKPCAFRPGNDTGSR